MGDEGAHYIFSNRFPISTLFSLLNKMVGGVGRGGGGHESLVPLIFTGTGVD